MKSKFQFYKNIILVVASALTLIAVTFAWFSSSSNGLIPTINNTISPSTVSVSFLKDDGTGTYTNLDGDIVLNDFVAGTYSKYKMIVATKTSSPLKLTMKIENLPSTMSADLKKSVCIKYEIMKLTKTTDSKGNVTYTDGKSINASDGYVPLSNLTDGVIFGLSLQNYQTTNSDYFVIYYEIGLSGSSPSSIEGMKSSLGSVNISAQQIG
jgi:hypothetical protein